MTSNARAARTPRPTSTPDVGGMPSGSPLERRSAGSRLARAAAALFGAGAALILVTVLWAALGTVPGWVPGAGWTLSSLGLGLAFLSLMISGRGRRRAPDGTRR